MPRQKITFDTVRAIGHTLPKVEDGTAYGSPALKVNGKLMAVIPTNKAAEPNSVAICIPFDQRDALLAEQPDVYYLKPHYEDYAVVLVRMHKIPLDALRDLLKMAWQFASASKPRVRKPKIAARRTT